MWHDTERDLFRSVHLKKFCHGSKNIRRDYNRIEALSKHMIVVICRNEDRILCTFNCEESFLLSEEDIGNRAFN